MVAAVAACHQYQAERMGADMFVEPAAPSVKCAKMFKIPDSLHTDIRMPAGSQPTVQAASAPPLI
ncbi:MAG: hypothetical protein ACLFMN_01915 [Desulfobacterales bacterium]